MAKVCRVEVVVVGNWGWNYLKTREQIYVNIYNAWQTFRIIWNALYVYDWRIFVYYTNIYVRDLSCLMYIRFCSIEIEQGTNTVGDKNLLFIYCYQLAASYISWCRTLTQTIWIAGGMHGGTGHNRIGDVCV